MFQVKASLLHDHVGSTLLLVGGTEVQKKRQKCKNVRKKINKCYSQTDWWETMVT